jgi:hypothetical protein
MEIAFRLKYLSKSDYQQIHRLVHECIAVTYGLKKSLISKIKQ